MPKIIQNLENKLIEEARKQIEASGYGAVTIRSIAQAYGVGVGTVYNYFPSKEVLIAKHLLDDWQQCITASLAVSRYSDSPRPVALCIYDQLVSFSSRHAAIFLDEAAKASFAASFGKYHNLLRNDKCALNFVDDSPKTFKECVKLSWPGDKPEDKMPKCQFRLEKGQAEGQRPMVLTDAIQVIECTWVWELDNAQNDLPGNLNGYEPPYHDFNGITSKFGAHFILKVDKILMKKQYADAIINGVKASDFPSLPVDYGYRDSKNFWFHRKRRMRSELLPMRQQSLESVRYAADRADDQVKFTDDALEMILNVPRVFLPLVLKGCVDWAKENNCRLITAKEMQIINDKRAKEKNKK